MRTLLIAMVGLLVTLPGVANAAQIVINNGLAPPNPENVIDHATYSSDDVYVRNSSLGDPTEVVLVDGGAVDWLEVSNTSTVTISGGTVTNCVDTWDSSTVTISGGTVTNCVDTWDSSTVTISGGTVQYLRTFRSATVTMSGGTLGNGVFADHSSTVTISGGTLQGDLVAHSSSTIITIVGRDFKVDGEPVPYGNLTAQFGTLTGTLASGTSLDNGFHQGGIPYGGTITLVRPSLNTPTLAPWSQLVLVMGLLAAGLGVWRWRAT